MALILDDKYEILEFTGKGNASTVFKARHIRSNEYVAVKSFRREQVAGIPDHFGILLNDMDPAFVRILDIFEDEKLLYIVTDYVEGESLQALRERVRVIPEGILVTWFRQLAEVLRLLHAQNPPVLFREMQPSGVMVQRDGKLKVLEFAVVTDNENAFAAPEQFMLDQCDERSDIYALGLTMYYLATGKGPLTPPFGYIPARQVNPDISPELEYILDKCVKYDPSDRYQSADELLRDLYQ